jgi:hypothetical protein
MSDAAPLASGTNWTYAGGIYTLKAGANVTVGGTSSNNRRLTVEDDATITLTGVSIIELEPELDGDCPLWLSDIANVTLILADGLTNTLAAKGKNPAIHVPAGATLTITGTGTLHATSTGSGTAIGGHDGYAGGNITINSGTIIATSGGQGGVGGGAGIGGGYKGDGGTITINGGTVTATGGAAAPGSG